MCGGYWFLTPKLTRIMVYPVKSCGGVELESAELRAGGLAHDRRWMLLDERGRMATQRRHPEMARIRAAIEPDALRLRAPGMPELSLPFAHERQPDTVTVPTWHGRTEGIEVGSSADRWFGRFLGISCRLVRMPDTVHRQLDSAFATADDRVGYADAFPVLLVNEASLADLNARLYNPIPVERFRPNLVVGGSRAFEEDDWEKIEIGDASFRVAEPCPRCSVITVDQESGRRTGTEPLRSLAGYRWGRSGLHFGANLIPDNEALLKREDPVRTFTRDL